MTPEQVNKRIKLPLNNEQAAIFALMTSKCEKIGWPIAYRDDLEVWDRNMIAEMDITKDRTLVYLIRENGTHLWEPEAGKFGTSLREGNTILHCEKLYAGEIKTFILEYTARTSAATIRETTAKAAQEKFSAMQKAEERKAGNL